MLTLKIYDIHLITDFIDNVFSFFIEPAIYIFNTWGIMNFKDY
jgi:hypothetical protein